MLINLLFNSIKVPKINIRVTKAGVATPPVVEGGADLCMHRADRIENNKNTNSTNEKLDNITETLNTVVDNQNNIKEELQSVKTAQKAIMDKIESLNNSKNELWNINDLIPSREDIINYFHSIIELTSTLPVDNSLLIFNILASLLILTLLISTLIIFYSNYLIAYFKIGERYPKLKIFLEYRIKFQRFYLFYNIAISAFFLLFIIFLNFVFLFDL
uniref:hypothetical protein n=1 Tax=Poriella subacida TaxID=2872513 RepID=UPI0030033FEC|nr:hypothetical protein [Poriella subacida]